MTNLKISLLFILSFCSCLGFSQDSKAFNKVYLQLNAGYSIPVSRSNIGSPLDQVGTLIYAFDGTSLSIKNPVNSRGAGTTIKGNLGYNFNESIALDVGMSFLHSNKILDAEQSTVDDFGRPYFARQESFSNILRFSTSVLIRATNNKKVTPFVKVGVLLPVVGKTLAKIEIADQTGRTADEILPVIDEALGNTLAGLPDSIPPMVSSNIQATTNGQFSVGFLGSFGIEYEISSKWSFIADVEFNMLRIKSKKTTVTSFETQGSADLNGLTLDIAFDIDDIPEIIRIVEYVNEVTEASNYTYDIDAPSFNRDMPRQAVEIRPNYNNIGLFVGVMYKFSPKSRNKSDSFENF